MRNGRKDGLWEYYNNDGALIYTEYCVNGICSDRKSFTNRQQNNKNNTSSSKSTATKRTLNYSNAEYYGYVKNGKEHGQGTITWTDGDKYVGEWKDGMRHGQGTYTYKNGDEYVGDFKNNKLHGQGTYTFGPKSKWAGDEYTGGWKDGEKHGNGTYTYADGGKFVGEYKDGNRNGQGLSLINLEIPMHLAHG